MWFPSQPGPPHPQPHLSALTQPSPSPAFHPFPFLLSSSLTLLFFYREHLAFFLAFFSLSLSLSVVFCHFSFLSFPSFFSVHFSVLLSLSLLPGLYDYLSLLRSLFVSVVPWLLLFAAVSDSKNCKVLFKSPCPPQTTKLCTRFFCKALVPSENKTARLPFSHSLT